MNKALVSLLISTLCLAGCASITVQSKRSTGAGAEEAVQGRHVPEGATAPLFGDLGDHSRAISTELELAQRYFDQGLILIYGFNHFEAARSFREAQRLDPNCAMCAWGEAYALGPNINKPMDDADVAAAWSAVEKAQAAATSAESWERDLVDALATRYASEPVADRSGLDAAYADAMREVARNHPDDLDIQTLFAEAVMDTMPWDYYREDGAPKAATEEVVATLESVLERDPYHPGAIHYYIHAVEPSDTPERAEAPADRLRGLVPGAGHLVHMPSHIYLRVGRYNDASEVNEDAAAADESYITQCRAQGFYPAAYYPHNIDFLQASAGFEGRSRVAIDAARKLRSTIPDELADEVPIVEEFMPRYLYALARFGRWDDILSEPRPKSELRYLTGAWHYTRGLAYASTGRLDDARNQLVEVDKLQAEWAKTDFVFLSGSSPAALLEIASKVLSARIAGSEGKWDSAVVSLTRAVESQDALPYTEPPPWYFPVREALGVALLESGRASEAAEVYKAQLDYTPRNGWSLFGLAMSLEAQGDTAGAKEARSRFEKAWRLADIELTASTF